MGRKSQYVMAIDVGTGAGRCFVCSLDGTVIHQRYQEWTYRPVPEAQPGGLDFDPGMFWGILSGLVRRTLTECDLRPEDIVAVSSTSQREGIVLLDRQGRELYGGPNIDQRAPSDAAAFESRFGQRLHHHSGHWPFPMFAPYRLLWFREHRPDLLERSATMLLLNDWVLYRLSGEAASEPSNGDETLLFDLRTRTWVPGLLEELGLPGHLLPPVLPSGARLGSVTAAASAATGLSAGTPVIMGGGDTQCALLGMGAVHPGDVGAVLGTYGPVMLVVDRPVIDDPRLAWSGCHVVDGRYVLESTCMEAGQTFRWVRDLFFSGETGEDIYARMDAEAFAAPPGARGIQAYIGPRLPNYCELRFTGPGGFRTQLPPMPGTAARGDFARSALEAVAYGVHANVRRLERLAGTTMQALRVCGGLSRSRTLAGVLSALSGVPVHLSDSQEGSSLGAAICAGVGAGAFGSFADGVSALARLHPEPAAAEPRAFFYRQEYERWMAAVPVMYGAEALLA